MSAEQKSPVEQFNAQLENAVLEYKNNGKGTVVLTPAGFVGMVEQFLSNPTGTAALVGEEAQKQVGLLRILTNKVLPKIGRNEKGTAFAQVFAEDVDIAVMGGQFLQFHVKELNIQFTQSEHKQHQVELKTLKISPDISISEVTGQLGVKLPVPLPGNIGGIIYDAFAGGFLMAGLYDVATGLVLAKKVEEKIVRVEMDILPDEGVVKMALVQKGLNPNYPVSMQYKTLKYLQEWLAKKGKKT